MAFKMAPPFSGYANLRQPMEKPAFERSYDDYPETSVTPPGLEQMPANDIPLHPMSDRGAETSYKGYASNTYLDADSYGDEPTQMNDRHGNPWRPGFFEQFPWLGILALIGTILTTFAAVIVLQESNGKPIQEWSSSLQPTVYISIFTALANVLLTYALYQGIVILFWRKAGQGATLLELHQYWASGSSFYGAIQGIFKWTGKAASLACIFTIVSILRGPLMQRASSVKNIDTSTSGNLTAHLATGLPLGWAGVDSGRTVSPSYLSPNFTNVMQAYTNHDSMTLVHSDCGSSCQTSLKGFGWGVSCEEKGVFYQLAPIIYPNGSSLLLDPVDVFSISAAATIVYGHGNASEYDYYGNPPSASSDNDDGFGEANTGLLLNATFISKSTQSDNGTMTQHLCTLRAGIVSYPVLITNGTVALQSPSWRNDTFLEDQGLLPLSYNSVSNIGGFVLAANNLYESSANLQFGGGAGWILDFIGFPANQYLQATNLSLNLYEVSQAIAWNDPMDDMINGMREIAFRASLSIANTNLTFPDSNQTVPYTGSQPETVYTSNVRYMVSAVLVSLLGVVFVAPTFWGWWELGRKVTLSPLEVAKAFDAPILGGAESNASAQKMLQYVGNSRVRYGDVNAGAARKLQILSAELVKPPQKGLRYL